MSLTRSAKNAHMCHTTLKDSNAYFDSWCVRDQQRQKKQAWSILFSCNHRVSRSNPVQSSFPDSESFHGLIQLVPVSGTVLKKFRGSWVCTSSFVNHISQEVMHNQHIALPYQSRER